MGQYDEGPSWLQRSLGACSNKMMADIINDNRGDRPTSGSMIPSQPSKVVPVGSGKVVTAGESEAPQDRSGWRDSPQLRQPDGVSLVDQLVDQQDLLDFAARARELAAASGLSYGDWLRMMEQDLRDRKARKEKADKVRKETPK
jgi:hypothetical protein